VVAVVEVTSFDRDARRRDGIDKPRAYAETGIAVYFVVDRLHGSVVVYGDPDGTGYRSVQRVPVGAAVHVPEPVALDLDTKPLLDWIA
jgi:hypothetical protein